MKTFILLGLALIVPATARAATYDIHPTDDLFARLGTLAAGDEVIVHAGTYMASGSGFVQVNWPGTAAMPIVVHAAPGDRPILMGNPSQNVMNISGSYFTLRGFEITGGSHGIRLGPTNVDHATIEDNFFHALGDVGVSCNFHAVDCGFVTIRHNEITDTGAAGTGEGMYLGCNDADCIFHDSIVEQNWVHATGGSQGDGIEVKTGAYSNVIRDNVVTNTMYPGITMYGFAVAAGHLANVVERNLVWHTGDNGIQTVGQIVVRNNIVVDAAAGGIASKPSQGFDPHDITIVNNTVVGDGDCIHTNGWETQTGQAVIDNAFYCGAGNAIRFATGLGAGADIRGNMGLGGTGGAAGFTAGGSLAADIGAPPNVYPPSGSPLINAGSVAGAATDDFDALARTDGMPDVGAYERSAAGMPAWIPTDGFKGTSGTTTMMDGGVPMSDAGPAVDGGPGIDGGPSVDGGGRDGAAADGPAHLDAGTGTASGGCCRVAGGRADVPYGMLALLALVCVIRRRR